MGTALDIDALVGARYISRGGDLRADVTASAWSFAALKGRVVQVEGTASLTSAFDFLYDAQRQAETAVWITGAGTHFFPPDAARRGIDLSALPIVRLKSRDDQFKAADRLLRSGGFGVVAVDLADSAAAGGVADSMLYRLAGLARANNATLLILPAPGKTLSNSAISLTVNANPSKGQVTITALKDKVSAPGWTSQEAHSGPVGMR